MVELRTHIPRRVQHFGFVTKKRNFKITSFSKIQFPAFSPTFPVPVMPGADAQQIAHHVALLFAPDLLHVLVGTHRSEKKINPAPKVLQIVKYRRFCKNHGFQQKMSNWARNRELGNLYLTGFPKEN